MRKLKFNNNKFFNPGEKTLEDKFPARGIHDLINAARNVLAGGWAHLKYDRDNLTYNMKYNAADAQVSCSSYCTDISARVIFSDLLYQQCAICRIKP